MAKQGGPFWFNRTYGNISFYIREGIGLVRAKSNLTARRVKTDPAFKNSRKSAGNFGLANKMASPLHKTIPVEFREKAHFTALRNLGIELFSAGASIQIVQKTMEVAVQNLIQNLQQQTIETTDSLPEAINNPITAPNLFMVFIHHHNTTRHRIRRRSRSACRAALTAAAQQYFIPQV